MSELYMTKIYNTNTLHHLNVLSKFYRTEIIYYEPSIYRLDFLS